MPNGLPITWEQYKAYLEEVTRQTAYPGFWDKSERKADLERLISQAEAILGANPETAFMAMNISRLMGLPYFAPAFEFTSGMPLNQWYTTYTKALPEIPEEVPTELTPWEEWQKEKAMLPYEQMTAAQQAQLQLGQQELAWEQQQFQWQQQQAGVMTPWQQEQARLNQLQYAAQLAGLGDVGWIEQWYAQQAQQARFAQGEPKPWWTEGHGLAGIAGWKGMQPEERGDWMRRYERSHLADIHPQIQARMREGWGLPDFGGKQGSLGEPPPAERVNIKPDGTISISMPMTGQVAYQQTGRGPIQPTGETANLPMAGRAAQQRPYPVDYTKKKKKKKARPRPTAPPFPAELGAFLPAGRVGKPIEKGWQMPTPSGQLWGKTAPSTKGKLKGYTRYGGGTSYEDLMARMEWQRPRTPASTYGRRWGVPRQY